MYWQQLASVTDRMSTKCNINSELASVDGWHWTHTSDRTKWPHHITNSGNVEIYCGMVWTLVCEYCDGGVYTCSIVIAEKLVVFSLGTTIVGLCLVEFHICVDW